MDRIGRHLANKGFVVSEWVGESDGSVAALELEFGVSLASGVGSGEVQSRKMAVRVVEEHEYGSIKVFVPNAWCLEGVPDQRRARLLENLLDPDRNMPIGMRLHYLDGLCGPCCRIGASENQLPERVSEAVAHLFSYIAVVDSSVRQVLENGYWVEPELLDVGYEELRRQTQEVVDRVEEESEERLVAILGRACLALRQIKEHEDGESDGGFDPAVEPTNAAFVVQGRVTRMCLTMDLDALERGVEPLEARAHELSAGHVTTS